MGSISQEKQFKTPWVETPLVESAPLSRAAGCRIFLKLENVQPSGSFKSRAMGSQILSHLQKPENANRAVHFFASSGGNAGLAAVCAARSLGYPCTVVVPMSTKPLMFRKLLTAGAHEVIQHGESIWEAGEFMKNELMQKMNPAEPADIAKIALHPFDSQSIWDGNSTIVDELVAQLPPPETASEKEVYGARPAALDGIVCSVGGGGLINGLIMGLERHSPKLRQTSTSTSTSTAQKNPIRLLAIETAGTDSLATAMNSKSLVSLPKITSQATSLGAIRVSEKTFEYAVNPPPGMAVHSSVLSDADAARGVLRLADEERLLVELACGVCVEAVVGDGARARREQGQGQGERGVKRRRVTAAGAAGAAGKHRDEGYGDDRSTDEEGLSAGEGDEELGSKLKQLVPELKEDSRVVIVVCGGSNVTIDLATEYSRLLDEGWE